MIILRGFLELVIIEEIVKLMEVEFEVVTEFECKKLLGKRK